MNPLQSQPCFCGSDQAFDACCRPRHLGIRPAETAEALMRSRYAAFADGRVDYLIKTLHHSKRRPGDHAGLLATLERTVWTGLRVLETQQGGKQDDRGVVEFVAFFEEKGARGDLHERSTFVREGGLWFYVDGGAKPHHKRPGRRDRCWCGSGRLYRKCHGR